MSSSDALSSLPSTKGAEGLGYRWGSPLVYMLFQACLESTNQWNCFLTYFEFLKQPLTIQLPHRHLTIRCCNTQNEAFSQDILVGLSITLLFFFFLSIPNVKSKAWSNAHISCSSKSQVSKKICTNIGMCCTKQVRLKTVCFLKTTFMEFYSKANLSANIEKNIPMYLQVIVLCYLIAWTLWWRINTDLCLKAFPHSLHI